MVIYNYIWFWCLGIKCCVHIHGVFPYMYVPFDGEGDADVIMYRIMNELENSLNVSMNLSKKEHIFEISLVKGM